ncbi:MAG: hypothetical protein ACXVGN_00245 [Mycobacteriaceae bacterium]
MNILAASELRGALGRALDSTLDKHQLVDGTESTVLDILIEFVERLGDELS